MTYSSLPVSLKALPLHLLMSQSAVSVTFTIAEGGCVYVGINVLGCGVWFSVQKHVYFGQSCCQNSYFMSEHSQTHGRNAPPSSANNGCVNLLWFPDRSWRIEGINRHFLLAFWLHTNMLISTPPQPHEGHTRLYTHPCTTYKNNT